MIKRVLIACAILLGASAASADNYTMIQGNSQRSTITIRCSMINGVCVPLNGLLDPNGNPYGPANPLPIGPGIVPLTGQDRGGTIAAANTAQQVMAANSARRAGWITADPFNAGTLYVSYTGAASTAGGAGSQCVLTPSASCPLSIAGGVEQSAISIAGTAAGDKFAAVEFQ